MAKKKKVAKKRIASASGHAGGGGNQVSGNEIEKAMADAGLQAMEDGITDPDEIRELKLAARAALTGKEAVSKKKK